MSVHRQALTLVFVLALAVGGMSMIRTQSAATEPPAEIVSVIEDYFHGTFDADRARLERAFHGDAHIVGFLGESLSDETAEQFIARIAAGPSQADRGETFRKRILDASLTDNAGMVIAEVYVADRRFVDYITVLKIDGRWKIRNKSFTTPVWP